MDEWALAADRHGIAATADLRRAGLGPGQIESLVAFRELTPLARGWYAVGVPNGPEDRHILTTRAPSCAPGPASWSRRITARC